uniref:Uncharacterized protein n=1 Tax=Anopheles maculatus TaxID=74869 RepID=A0A182T1K9_9DIPT
MKPQTTVPMESNDFHVPKNGDHHQNGAESLPTLVDPNAAPFEAAEQQQHSSFESSGTASTVTTESTIVTAGEGANSSSNADQLIDFASFSTTDDHTVQSMAREGSVSDANFNPLAPLDVHNASISNNNSINPFFSSNYPVCDDGSGGNHATEAVLFDLSLDNTTNGGGTNTSSTFFNNNNNNTPPNNNNNNNTTPSWLVSATTDGQENRVCIRLLQSTVFK